MKKGQGISINMVIIAAIALIVLVVAAIIIMKGGKNVDVNAGGSSCLSRGGICRSIDSNGGANNGCGPDEQKITGNCEDNTRFSCCQYSFS